eukprot:Gb_16191 [translate_table: standard]
MQDDFAVCCLIKGTALRELGRLDAAQECLDHLREENCDVGTELFVFPMAAYERALLLINQHIERVTCDSEQATNYDILKQAEKELATAEAFKHDYNFLWRLLGRVHAARGAIQALKSDEVLSMSPQSAAWERTTFYSNPNVYPQTAAEEKDDLLRYRTTVSKRNVEICYCSHSQTYHKSLEKNVSNRIHLFFHI